MKKVLLAAALSTALLLPSAASGAGPATPPASSASAPAAKSAVHDCAWATRVANLGLRRYKKVYKKWRNGHVSTRHMKWARRIWKSELRQKAEICSQPSGGGPNNSGPGGAQPLNATEVQNRVYSVAYQYYLADDYAVGYGAASTDTCDERSTYRWICYGWNDEQDGAPFYGARCWFREVVSRTGTTGITSYSDSSYGNGGWACV